MFTARSIASKGRWTKPSVVWAFEEGTALYQLATMRPSTIHSLYKHSIERGIMRMRGVPVINLEPIYPVLNLEPIYPCPK
jgi:hypothetical protein